MTYAPYGVSPSSSGAATPLLRAPSPPPSGVLPARVLQRGRQNVSLERHNLTWLVLPALLRDFVATMVSCPPWLFYSLFLALYLGQFAAFAALYASQPGCISFVSTYAHAFWFSVHSAATIGYGQQAPSPDCPAVQLGILGQTLLSLYLQGSLVGLVFARISNSAGRAATIRFSKAMSMYEGDDGLFRLAFRLANLRKHQVLQPEVRLLLLRRAQVAAFSSADWEYLYTELHTQHLGGGKLWLGVPSVVEHVVGPSSPLWGLSEEELRSSEFEFVVILDGIDEATARAIEARHSYVPPDIRWQHRFQPCLHRRRSGRLGVDFSKFDGTAPRSGTATPPVALSPLSSGASGSFASAAAAAAAAVAAQQQQEVRLVGAAATRPASPAGGLQRRSAAGLGAQVGAYPQAGTFSPAEHLGAAAAEV